MISQAPGGAALPVAPVGRVLVAALVAFVVFPTACSTIDGTSAETPSTAASAPATNSPTTERPTITTTPSTTTTITTTTITTTTITTTTEPITTTSTTEPTTTTLPPLRDITPDAPLRGFVGGDSLPAYVITALNGGIAETTLLDLRYDAKISSSLVRPSFFDWPEQLGLLVGPDDTLPDDTLPDDTLPDDTLPDDTLPANETAPEAIVFMIGGNDNQPMTNSEGERLATLSPEWQDEYRRRVARIMDITDRSGTRMLWIGLPPPRDGVRLELNPTINTIVRSEAEQRPWVTYLDIMPLLSDADGNYAASLPGPDGGDPITVRPRDGVHITYGASRWIADLVWDWMTQTWSIPRTD